MKINYVLLERHQNVYKKIENYIISLVYAVGYIHRHKNINIIHNIYVIALF